MVNWMMAIIFVFLIILTPLFFGEVIAGIFREKNPGVFEKYAYGFLSLLLVSFGITLVTVKFRISFEKYSLFILLVWGLSFLTGVIFSLWSLKGKRTVRKTFCKYELWYLIPAVLLFAYSYLYLAPSFANDDTWEVVATTVRTGTIFEYSAMTGAKMVNGLPIFNKIYFLPLLYAAFAGRLKLPVDVWGSLVVSVMVFVTNLGLVRKLGLEIKVKNISSFMILYMLILIGGTYLPVNGIPVTFGYAILREAYSGYGIFYGVVLPVLTLLLIRKRWLFSVFLALVSFGLLRLDRIFFALTTPASSWAIVNGEGKMAIFTILSLAVAFCLRVMANTAIEWKMVLCPPAFVSYVTDKIVDVIRGKNAKRVFLLGMGIFILVSCYFEPFKDAMPLGEYLDYEKEVAQKLSELESEDCCILAPVEFMGVTRRLGSNVRTLFGRDDVSSYMVGLDYEDTSEYVTYYYRYTLNHYLMWEPYYIPYTEEELLDFAKKEGMDYLIFP